MSLPALATITQLEAITGTTVENTRAQALLDAASAIVRRYLGQTITRVENDVATLTYDRGRLILPERPADRPTLVTGPDGGWTIPASAWTWNGGGELLFLMPSQVANGPNYRLNTAARSVTVTYSHGYEETPADIVLVVCQMVDRVLNGVAPDTPGMLSGAIDDFQYKLVQATGSLGLTADDRAILNSYRSAGVGSVRLR